MAKPTRKPVVHGSPVIPDQRCPISAERDELAAEIADNPAFRRIAEYLEHAKSLGFDPAEPDVIRRALSAGRVAHDRDLQGRVAVTTWSTARRELTDLGVARHHPVVYYVRLGQLVKIGTTTRIVHRCESLGVQGVLAVEAGDSVKEHGRHREFAHLRKTGEWFELSPDLADHIARVRADFETQMGITVEAWLETRRHADADFRARNLHKVNETLYSDGTTSLPASGPLETLVTGADAARFRGISPQLLNGWRERHKIRPVGATTDGRPLYRLSEVIHLDEAQRASPMSHRQQ